LRLGSLEIDVPRHEVRIDGDPVTLTATEFKLLEILARRRGRVQTRERLLQDVWGYDNPIDSRTVDTHMRRLREKVGVIANYLETIRGVGYRFVAEE
jgi:two-component system phosphate regulon response regulator PhoB